MGVTMLQLLQPLNVEKSFSLDEIEEIQAELTDKNWQIDELESSLSDSKSELEEKSQGIVDLLEYLDSMNFNIAGKYHTRLEEMTTIELWTEIITELKAIQLR